MKKLIFLILILLLTACGKAAPKPTATLAPTATTTPVTPATLPPATLPPATMTSVATEAPTLAPTATKPATVPTLAPTNTLPPQPTPTPAPTETPTVLSTATPLPPLAAKGPYLLYLSTLPEGGQAITLLNKDGIGSKVFPLPSNALVPDVRNAVSPDGSWMSFYTGNAGRIESGVFVTNSGPFTLTLNLMNLFDGSTKQVASLLTTDYPANFQKAAEQAIQASPSQYKDVTPEQLANSIAQSFLDGIYTSGWSRNSTYLAFASEETGPTSDLYAYNVTNGRTFRITGEPEQIQWLTWSSDNVTILYGTTNQNPGDIAKQNYRVIRVDGSAAQNLGQLGYRAGWATARVYTIYSPGQNGGFTGLTNIDIFTRQATIIWAYPFLDFDISLQDGTLAIIAYSTTGASQQTGVYLQASNWLFTPLNATNIYFRGITDHPFIAISSDKGLVGIAKDGTITTIRASSTSINPSISPNWNWLVLFDAAQTGNIAGIELYDNKDQQVHQLGGINPNRIIWRADSQGLFTRSGTDLYYIAIPDGQPVLVAQNVAVNETGDFNNFTWIR